ncbi:MAG: transcription antitermination factor NusB [bacterium]|nr:transcription antitermination factor NusB [bacterium]
MSATSHQVRRRARECAVQFLFGIDFTSYEWQNAILDFWACNPAKKSVREYAEHLVGGVMDRREELDEAISECLENWTLDRVGAVERNVLRVAWFEMLHGSDVPAPVAINEALEVAKRFGADDAPRFVNGVLDRLKDNLTG